MPKGLSLFTTGLWESDCFGKTLAAKNTYMRFSCSLDLSYILSSWCIRWVLLWGLACFPGMA